MRFGNFSENFKLTQKKNIHEKAGTIVSQYQSYQTTHFNKCLHNGNCGNNYVCLNVLITYRLIFDNILSLHYQRLIIVDDLCK